MTKNDVLRVLGVLLILVVVAPPPSHANSFDVVTLTSPNGEPGGSFGCSVAGAGDVNQDGFADLIVGSLESPGGSPPQAGRAYLFSGKDNSLLFELISPNEEYNGNFGRSVSGVGDVNGDGHADVIVGTDEDPARAYVFSGQDGTLLLDLTSPNQDENGFGIDPSGAGDINQDGFADVVVGSISTGPYPWKAGSAYVFSGQDGSLLLKLVSPEERLSFFGSPAAGVGDVNQDGFPDVVVAGGEKGAGGERRVYVFSGQDGRLILRPRSAHPSDRYSAFGASLAGGVDVNHDGFPDVVVGAPDEFASGKQQSGRAYLFSGQDGSRLLELVSPNVEESGRFGGSVSTAGDVNQDGFADVVVGAAYEGPSGMDDAGRAYVLSGRDGSLLLELISPNEEEGGDFGFSVARAGDVNQDGLTDLMVGAPHEGDQYWYGRVYLYVSSNPQGPGIH